MSVFPREQRVKGLLNFLLHTGEILHHWTKTQSFFHLYLDGKLCTKINDTHGIKFALDLCTKACGG